MLSWLQARWETSEGGVISREEEIYPSLQNYMKASLPLPHPTLSWPKPNFKVVPTASNIKQGAVRTPVPHWSGLFHLLPLSSHQLMYSPYSTDCRGSAMFLLDFFRKCITAEMLIILYLKRGSLGPRGRQNARGIGAEPTPGDTGGLQPFLPKFCVDLLLEI